MKTSKKILSIVLAVMLLVGTVAVGVSADTTMVYEKAGSRLVYTATASKAANADGIIEVNPGETITVSVYAQANYYFGPAGSEIFCWTAGFFNPFTTADVAVSNYVNNYDAEPKHIASNKATQLGTGYNKGTHEGVLNLRGYSTTCTSPFDASEATLGYTFTFTVPEDATLGATGEFRMPETCSATVATQDRQRQIYQAVNNSATEYSSGTAASLYPETIDLTGTVLNFKVATAAAPEEPCDYDALDRAIAAYEAEVANKDLYKNWAGYEAAYNDAKAVERDMIDDEDDVNQSIINDAEEALRIAGEILEYKDADYTAVNEAIASIPADLSIYTEASAKAVNDAVEAVEEGLDITYQDEVDEMAAAIADAVNKLVPLEKCDYTALDAAIAAYEAEVANKDLYKNWAGYEDAYDAAKAVERDMYADEDDVNQSTINDAEEALRIAGEILEYKDADYTAVNEAIASIPEDLSIYTEASVKAVNDAVEAVEEGLDITYQDEVDEMAAAIADAVNKLVPLEKCDYTALDAAIAAYEAEVANKDLYKNWAGYEAAYDAAKAVERDMIADEDDVNQSTINDAEEALRIAGEILEYKDADYAAVEAALARAAALDRTLYTEASLNAVDEAVGNVVKNLDITFQEEVNEMAAAIEGAIANLVPLEKCDYTALDAAIAAYEAEVANKDLYKNWAGYEAAYNDAKAVERDMIDDEDDVNQSIINDAEEALRIAGEILEYKDADYTAVNEAIASIPADLSIYTEASVKAVNDAVEAVEEGLDITYQDEVDEMAAAIADAVAKLAPLGTCDYTALDEAIAAYEAEVANKDLYTNWAGYEAAYDAAKAVERDMIADEDDVNQSTINDAEEALRIAGEILEYKDADYTAVNEAIASIPEDLTIYTEASVKAVNDAVAAVEEGLDITYQDEVDEMAAAIADAVAKLAPLGTCDYTALDEAIAAYEAEVANKDLYKNWAGYEEAYDAAKAVERDMIADEDDVNQSTINDAEEALRIAGEILEYKDADYTAVNDAIASIPEDMSTDKYTAASVKAVNDAVAAVVEGYDITKQTEVDEMAAAIADAVAKLAPLGTCDYTALDTAIATVPGYGAEYYNTEDYEAYQATLAAAQAIARDMINDEAGVNQKAIDDAAQALANAYIKLVPAFIDYSALEAAVAAYGKTPEAADAYTDETYAPYAAALAAANEMLENKQADAPASNAALAADIATAAAELEKTYKALELAPISAIVTKVTPKADFFKVGDTVEVDYLVSVTGITKLQVAFTGGTTSTYTRTHSAVKITDNGDGTETWTIATRIFAETVTAKAKAKLGKVWEADGYPFTLEVKPQVSTEDIEVKSVEILKGGEAVTSFTTKDTVITRIVCGPDTLRMRLVAPGGSTATYARSKATQDADGNWVWEISTRKTSAGVYTLDIHTAGESNKLVDSGADVVLNVEKYVAYVGPSTGNAADIVVSATVAKTRLLVGDKQTVTVVTDKDAIGARIVDAEGDVHYQTKDTTLAVDNGDGTLTWSFEVLCGYAATYTFDVQALYGNQWQSNGTSITYRVVY